MPTFVPGLELSRLFHAEAARPILEARFPGVAYSAALIGYGSDVLGYDTERSTDHEWGPRLLLFLTEADHPHCAPQIDATLREQLPPTFRGFPTAFTPADENGVRRMTTAVQGHIAHHVQITTVRAFALDTLGRDPDEPLHAADWLALPQQQLLELTTGEVFHDGLGALAPLRERFAYFPREVWRYLLAAQWTRIAQEEAFMARCGEVGDELGSRILAARLARDIMRLCFLMERRYAPYAKWLGTAFSRLACAPELGPHLAGALGSPTWQERERGFCHAYEAVARLHNALGLTPPLATTCTPYFDRPYLTLHAGRFADALVETIHDGELRAILDGAGLIGGIDQWADNSDLLDRADHYSQAMRLYKTGK